MNISGIGGINYPSFKMIIIPKEKYPVRKIDEYKLRSIIRKVGKEYELPDRFYKINKNNEEYVSIALLDLYGRNSDKNTSNSKGRRTKIEKDIIDELNKEFKDEKFADQTAFKKNNNI